MIKRWSLTRLANSIKTQQGHIDAMWFFDEAHCYLSAIVNKRNFRFCVFEKHDWYHENPLHHAKVTVWAALGASDIIASFFIEVYFGQLDTVNSEHYLNILRKKFMSALEINNAMEMNVPETHKHHRINV